MYKEVENEITDGGFLFDEGLKWFHGDNYVISARSINQSNKKCFWTENNDIEEYTHSLIVIGAIKRCCSIHVIRNSLKEWLEQIDY